MTQGKLDFPAQGEAAIAGAVGRRAGPGQVDRPEAAKTKKRIAITTLESWYRILPTLPERERAVACALQRFFLRGPSRWPTAYELFEFMKRYEQNVFDVNSVRPVLTRLKDKDIVQFGAKAYCQVTGMKVYTWEFVENLQLLMWAAEGHSSALPPGKAPNPSPEVLSPPGSKELQGGAPGKSGPGAAD